MRNSECGNHYLGSFRIPHSPFTILESPKHCMSPLFMMLLLVTGWGVFAYSARRRWKLLWVGAPENRFDRPAERLRIRARRVLSQRAGGPSRRGAARDRRSGRTEVPRTDPGDLRVRAHRPGGRTAAHGGAVAGAAPDSRRTRASRSRHGRSRASALSPRARSFSSRESVR